MALSTRVWRVGRLLLLLVALAATYVASAFVTTRVALKAREVRVPVLVGQPVAGAGATLAELGLALRVDESRRAEPKIPAGRIAQQDPAAGTVARRGRSVKVWVSTGNQAPPVPKLVGESERAARIRLQQDGLEVARVSEIRSNDFPADVVVGQDPPPQTRAPGVSLLVNRGEAAAAYVMPDLIGVNGYRAADAMRAAGFRVAVVAQNPYPGVPAGVVIRQSPQGGFQVTSADTISLEVSR
jgi:eukaryotic-like serine/threonine-protein kinase